MSLWRVGKRGPSGPGIRNQPGSVRRVLFQTRALGVGVGGYVGGLKVAHVMVWHSIDSSSAQSNNAMLGRRLELTYTYTVVPTGGVSCNNSRDAGRRMARCAFVGSMPEASNHAMVGLICGLR